MLTEHKVSVFPARWSKEPKQSTLEQVIATVKGEELKARTGKLRRLKAEGRHAEADKIKGALPAITAACICEGGHQAIHVKELTGLVPVDFDHTNTRTDEIFARVCASPHVAGAHITASGRGIKAFVSVTIPGREQYPAAFATAAAHLEAVTQFPTDPSGKNVNRLSYLCHHAEAYFNPEATPLEIARARPFATAPTASTPIAPGGYHVAVDAFVRSFLTLYPPIPGNRNNILFRLCNEAVKRGLPITELLPETIRQMAYPDFGEEEIRQTVSSVYQRKEQETREIEDMKSSQKLTICSKKSKDENEKGEISDGEELREQTPTFPDEVFDNLPDLLKECVKSTFDKRERDGLLLASITVISSMLPTVTTHYNRQRNWSNLYCVIIAPSGNSKGVFNYSIRLIEHYQEHWKRINEQREKEYEAELEQYEETCRQIKKNGQQTAAIICPKEPPYFYPRIPSDTSKARLLMHLKDNRECGTIMFETEADTLTSANKQDYGDFNDVLRKVYHNETVSCSFKNNNMKPIYVNSPSMSLFLSGTPAQLGTFTPGTENGLFSRLLTYTYRQQPVWKDVLTDEKDSMEEAFGYLSMRLSRMALYLKESPTVVKFTHTQREQFNSYFSDLLTDIDLQGQEDITSVVKRHGLMAARLCMIFTALDKATLQMDVHTICCSDSHFRAALSIIGCCLEHSKLLATSLKKNKDEHLPLTPPNKFDLLLEQLPNVFTYEEMVKAGDVLGISAATIKRMITKSIGLKINKLQHGVYARKI